MADFGKLIQILDEFKDLGNDQVKNFNERLQEGYEALGDNIKSVEAVINSVNELLKNSENPSYDISSQRDKINELIKQALKAVKERIVFDAQNGVSDSILKDLSSEEDEELKEIAELTFVLEGLSSSPSLPLNYQETLQSLVNEIKEQLPKDKSRIVHGYDIAIDKIISNKEELLNALKAGISLASIYVQSEDKTLDEVASECRFIGYNIVKNEDGKYVKGNNDSLMTDDISVELNNKDFLRTASIDKVLNFLNQKTIFTKIFGQKFFQGFREKYEQDLKNNGIKDSETLKKMVSPFNRDSDEFKAFTITDKVSRSILSPFSEYMKNQMALVHLKEFNQIDKLTFDSNIDMAKMVNEEYTNAYNANLNVIEQYRLIKPDHKQHNIVQEDVLKFIAIDKICENFGNELVSLDDFSVITDALTVEEGKVRLEFPEDKTDTKEVTLENGLVLDVDFIKKINIELDHLTINSIDELKKSYKERFSTEHSKEQEESSDSNDQVEKITDFKIVRRIYNDVPENGKDSNLKSIQGVFNALHKDCLNYIINNTTDTDITYKAWCELLGVDDILIFFKDKDDIIKGTELEGLKNQIVAAKNDSSKTFNLLTADFKQLLKEAMKIPTNENELLKPYIQLVLLNNELKKDGVRLSDLSPEAFNDRLNKINSGLSINGQDGEIKNRAEKLRYKTLASDLLTKAASSEETNSKEVVGRLLGNDKIKDETDEVEQILKQEQEELAKNDENDQEKRYNIETYAKKYNLVDNTSIVKKLKGYNTKYLTDLIDEICKSIKKTKVYTEISSKASDSNNTENNNNDSKTDDQNDTAGNKTDGTDENKTPNKEDQIKELLDKFLDLFKDNKDAVSENAVGKSKEQKELDQLKKLFGNLGLLCGGDNQLQNTILSMMLMGSLTNPAGMFANNGIMDFATFTATCTMLTAMTPLYLKQILVSCLGNNFDLSGDKNILEIILEDITKKSKKEESKRQLTVAKVKEGYDKLIKKLQEDAQTNPVGAFYKIEQYATNPTKEVQAEFEKAYGFDTTILLVALAIVYPEKYGHLEINPDAFTAMAAMTISQSLKSDMEKIKNDELERREQEREEFGPTM